MKFIVERTGSYTTTTDVWQRVVVEAADEEQAHELAWDACGDGRVKVVAGDKGDDWEFCCECDVTDAVGEEEFYARQQAAFAAEFAPVFETWSQSGR